MFLFVGQHGAREMVRSQTTGVEGMCQREWVYESCGEPP